MCTFVHTGFLGSFSGDPPTFDPSTHSMGRPLPTWPDLAPEGRFPGLRGRSGVDFPPQTAISGPLGRPLYNGLNRSFPSESTFWTLFRGFSANMAVTVRSLQFWWICGSRQEKKCCLRNFWIFGSEKKVTF